MDWSIVVQLGSMVAVGVGIYSAIKADLARMHEKIIAANDRITVVTDTAKDAHDRIDRMYRSETRV